MEAATCVRLGILSTASVTRHLLAVIASQNSDEGHYVVVAAVSSRSEATAKLFAAQHGIPKFYGDHAALLSDRDIDAVYIPLPNDLHAEWVVRALEAGKHVLCEKPLCLDVEGVMRIKEAQSRCSAARGVGLVVMEAVMSLYTPQAQLVKSLVDGKAIGEVHYMRGVFQYKMSRHSFRSSSVGDGGGSLWDVGCYAIYLARFLLGTEPAVSCGQASWSSTDSATRYDETFTGTLTFPPSDSALSPVPNHGVVLQFVSSLSTPANAMSFEIHGTQGSMYLANPFKPGAEDEIVLRVLDDNCDPGVVSERRLRPEMQPACLRPYEGELRAFCALVQGALKGEAWSTARCPTHPNFSMGNVAVIAELHRRATAAS